MSDDLEILDPAPHRVRFRGEDLDLRPLALGSLPAFSRLVRPVIAEFTEGRHPAWETDDELMILELTELHGERILEAAAIATGRPVAWIEAAENSAELLDLVRTIVVVNQDFFLRAMLAAARAHAPAPDRPADTDGPMPSSICSEPATH